MSSSSTSQGGLVPSLSLSLSSTVTTSSSNSSIDGGGDVGPSKSSSSSSSSSSDNKTNNKKIVVPELGDAYDPPPLIRSNIIWFWGLLIFGLAIIWPPLILLLTFVASRLVPYCYRITDDVSTRRQLLQEFETNDNVTSYRREIPDYVTLETNYWKNSRGLLLHTTIMIPSHMKEIKAIVGHCHAYTDNSTHTKRKELMHLVENGIAVLMIDYEGHGRSDGPLGLIQNWDVMTNDVHTYFQHILKSDSRLSNRNIFLLGESMGGAVAYSIIHEHPNDYAGVVFQAPMCKISKDMLPPNWVIDLLTTLVGGTPDAKTAVATPNALGYLPIAPAKGDLRTLTFKLQEKRAICTRVPTAFSRRPRLATARELINITKRISGSLSEFNSPFLIQHGDLDRVTDPELSKALYEEAASQDKTLKLYEGMWHSLIAGEPDTNVLKVQNDTTQWILERSSSSSDNNKSTSSVSDDDDHNGDAGVMTSRGLDGGRSQTKDSNERGNDDDDGNNNKGIFDWILDIGGNSNSSSNSNKNEQKDDKKQK